MLEPLVHEAEEDGIVQLVVGAVVTDEQHRVLLLKRRADDFMGGLWELPSGKVERDERLDAALVREVEEETGLGLIEITAYLGRFDYTSGSGKPSRQFNFTAKVAQTGPVRLTEHDAYQWKAIDDELPVSDAVKRLLGSITSR